MLIWRRFLFVFSIFLSHEIVSAKIRNGGSLGWPNFFNPKQAILRENGDKDTGNVEEENKSNAPPSTRSTGNEQQSGLDSENVEELIDYTIKGGLRGTYVLLNSSTNIANLEEEAQTAIKNIFKKDEELFKEVDDELSKGEVTDKGVRLRTPIVQKTHSKALGKYGARISFFAGEEFTKVIYFGNWCGRGGRSAPVDNIDGCCLEHEKCYGKHVRQCPDVWKRPYSLMYAWLVMNNDPVCVRSDSSCVNHVCECDREASLCLRHFLQNPNEVPLHVEPPHRNPKRSSKRAKKDHIAESKKKK